MKTSGIKSQESVLSGRTRERVHTLSRWQGKAKQVSTVSINLINRAISYSAIHYIKTSLTYPLYE